MEKHTTICLHPMNRREYYKSGLYKCRECGNVIKEHQNSTYVNLLQKQLTKKLITQKTITWHKCKHKF
jgi:hypothetical protein